MERFWPKGDGLPIFQFYNSSGIEDLLSSRAEVAGYTLEELIKHNLETNELSFIIHRDNFISRLVYYYGTIFFPHFMPEILIDKDNKPTLYRLTGIYTYIPRIRHSTEIDKEKNTTILFDDSDQIEVYFPDRIYLKAMESIGKPMNVRALKNDWQSDVILECEYRTNMDRYRLIEVLNKRAGEPEMDMLRNLNFLRGYF